SHDLTYSHSLLSTAKWRTHLPAYLVGLMHGLAGSGALMLIVMSKSGTTSNGLFYLIVFGIGSIAGMMLAAMAFSMPFTKKIFQKNILQSVLVFLSSSLCIGYGFSIIAKNLFS
ncbi:MAG: hypothetical protein RLZZ28_505, partial [Bacteroidota bacterium]